MRPRQATFLLEQNDEWAVQCARYLTLETVTLSDDPIVGAIAIDARLSLGANPDAPSLRPTWPRVYALGPLQVWASDRKAIELAKAGDMQALRLCMDRLVPPRKDSPVAFALPEMKTANDAVFAMGALVNAVAAGHLTPTEAAELTRMVQAFAKIIETAQFEERIRKLEEATHK